MRHSNLSLVSFLMNIGFLLDAAIKSVSALNLTSSAPTSIYQVASPKSLGFFHFLTAHSNQLESIIRVYLLTKTFVCIDVEFLNHLSVIRVEIVELSTTSRDHLVHCWLSELGFSFLKTLNV